MKEVREIGIFSKKQNQTETVSRVKMVTDKGNGFYAWDGKVYQSDIVRACMRPKVKAIGKLTARHIREMVDRDGNRNVAINPEPYMRFLLEEPSPHMSGQKMQEKLAAQLILNNNAFALISRDENGRPFEIYPISAASAEAIYDNIGNLYLKFLFNNGKSYMFSYSNIIHLRGDYNENDIFGDPLIPALSPLMDIVTTTDQGIVNAIKNSSIVRWLLKFTTSMRPEDIQDQTKQFADSFLSVEKGGNGVAGVDSKADAQQIKPNDYVPNAAQMDRTVKRIYALLNTNEKIVTSAHSEDEYNSYFDAEIEPALLDLKNEYTRKLFTRKERGFGNYIAFEASAWDSASSKTKANLVYMVDRGSLTPNEWRKTYNLAPLPNGDEPLLRKDTGVVKGGDDDED